MRRNAPAQRQRVCMYVWSSCVCVSLDVWCAPYAAMRALYAEVDAMDSAMSAVQPP